MSKKKVIRFRAYCGNGNPHDITIGCRNIMVRYQTLEEMDAAEKIKDIYLELVNYGDHGVDYVVAVYESYEQRFVAKKLEYFEVQND